MEKPKNPEKKKGVKCLRDLFLPRVLLPTKKPTNKVEWFYLLAYYLLTILITPLYIGTALIIIAIITPFFIVGSPLLAWEWLGEKLAEKETPPKDSAESSNPPSPPPPTPPDQKVEPIQETFATLLAACGQQWVDPRFTEERWPLEPVASDDVDWEVTEYYFSETVDIKEGFHRLEEMASRGDIRLLTGSRRAMEWISRNREILSQMADRFRGFSYPKDTVVDGQRVKEWVPVSSPESLSLKNNQHPIILPLRVELTECPRPFQVEPSPGGKWVVYPVFFVRDMFIGLERCLELYTIEGGDVGNGCSWLVLRKRL